MNKTVIFVLFIIIAVSTAAAFTSVKDGLVEYIGAQRTMFKTGKAESVISLESMAGRKGLFAVGPVEGLDGEVTIFDSRPYISKVRGTGYSVDNTFKHNAFFLVWAEEEKWRDIPVPVTVKSYLDLQNFIKKQATESGIDTSKSFPFLISGSPVEVEWHINVDHTDGKPITRELFVKSKAKYIMKNEPVDIVGFYSENHPGVFISQFAPALKSHAGAKNAIHMHVVSRAGSAAGHIDDLTLGTQMTLRLPGK